MKFTNIVRFFAASLLFACALTSSANEATKRLESRSPEFDYSQSRKDWLKSWHSNEVYKTRTDYNLECELTAVKNEEASWWAKAIAFWGTKANKAVSCARFDGKAVVSTVVCHEFPHLRLLRQYEHAEGNGLWSATVTPSSAIIRKAMAKSFGENGILAPKNIDIVWDFLPIDNTSKEWGRALYDMTSSWCGENIGKPNEDGVFSINGKSIIAKAMEADTFEKVSGMATQLNKDLTYIRQLNLAKQYFNLENIGQSHFGCFHPKGERPNCVFHQYFQV